MLRRTQVSHIIRAAAAVANHKRFVLVGTGAVIATASKPLPAAMMMTEEIDLYPEDAANPDDISDLIDASIGQDSRFHRTFGYYGHGFGATTALMPLDWRERAKVYAGAGEGVIVTCPDANDIAVAKLCAWRDKDRAWLRSSVQAAVVSLARMRELVHREMPAAAPPAAELQSRVELIAPERRG